MGNTSRKFSFFEEEKCNLARGHSEAHCQSGVAEECTGEDQTYFRVRALSVAGLFVRSSFLDKSVSALCVSKSQFQVFVWHMFCVVHMAGLNIPEFPRELVGVLCRFAISQEKCRSCEA